MRSFLRKLRSLSLAAVALAALAGLLCLGASHVDGQYNQPPGGPPAAPSPRQQADASEERPFPPELLIKAQKQRMEQRHQQMVSDSARLLGLARELQSEVNQAGNNNPPVNVARKADQIEKLARSVKDKMKAE